MFSDVILTKSGLICFTSEHTVANLHHIRYRWNGAVWTPLVTGPPM